MSGTERPPSTGADPERVGDSARRSDASGFDRSVPSSDADFAQPQLCSGSGYDPHQRDAGDEAGLGRRGLAGYDQAPHSDNQGAAGHWIGRPTGAGSAQGACLVIWVLALGHPELILYYDDRCLCR